MSLVLSVFICNPDIEPKVSKTFRAAKRDSLLQFKIRVVSSAYWEILYSVLLIKIPLLMHHFFINKYIISAQSKNR